MKTKFIIFDKDGTLLDFDSYWVKILHATVGSVLAQLRLPSDLNEDVCAALGVMGGTASIDGVYCRGDHNGMVEESYKEIISHGYRVDINEVARIFAAELRGNFGAGEMKANCSDLRRFLTTLHGMGIKTALVTSDDEFSTNVCLKKLGVEDCFEKVMVSDGIHPKKPEPYYINAICEEYAVAKDEVIMVGDTMVDIEFAKNAGVRAIGVAKNENNRKILEPHTIAVVKDLEEIIKYID